MIVVPKASDQEKINWLRLIRTENLGPRSFQTLMELYGTAQSALEAIPQLSQNGGEKIKPISESIALKEIDDLARIGAKIVLACEEKYPSILREIKDFPPVLTAMSLS